MTRKSFLQTTATSALGMMLPPLEGLTPFTGPLDAASGPGVKYLATSWGYPGSVKEFLEKAKADGFDGAELWFPHDVKAQHAIFEALAKTGMEVGFLCGAFGADPKTHYAEFEHFLLQCARQKRQRPLYINCHSGKDFFTPAQAAPFFDLTSRVAAETGIPVLHETHRGRLLFAAHLTADYLSAHPKLRLTLDISHWCNVHESLLEDQADTVELALERTDHIHARIGHSEGPQVNDPRAPEWEAAVKAHVSWWDTVVYRKKNAGELVTILTEFGPPAYLPALPYTQQPVADQWEVNVHMKNLLSARYGK